MCVFFVAKKKRQTQNCNLSCVFNLFFYARQCLHEIKIKENKGKKREEIKPYQGKKAAQFKNTLSCK